MPCVVPNCDPKGQCFALRFPQSYLLTKRWKKAIELGSGEALAEDVDLLAAEVCQQHFVEFNDYGEPIVFNSEDATSKIQEIRLACCGLCLKFALSDEILSDWEELILGDRSIKELLKSVGGTERSLSADYVEGICQPCLVRLDLVATITREMSTNAKISSQMESFIKAEKRAWFKSSRSTENDSLQPPASSSIFTPIVELKVEEPGQSENMGNSLTLTSKNSSSLEQIASRTRKNVSKKSMISSTCNDSERSEKKAKASHVNKTCIKKPKRPLTFKDPNKKPKEKVYLRKLNNQKCYICMKMFESSDALQAHLLEHNDTTLVCKECGETCWDFITYNRHLAKHDCNERPFKCKHCYKRFARPNARRIHEADIHNDGKKRIVKRTERAYTCQHCGKSCSSLANLKLHEDAHAGLKKFKCSICDKWFANRSTLERHHRTHTSLKPFVCKICNKSYRLSSFYEQHVKEGCHPSASNKCKLCSSDFRFHQDLVNHTLQEHSDEDVKIYHCKICDQRFLQNRLYYVHMTRHDKIASRKYQCQHCGKPFASAFAVKYHELTHTQKDVYKCSMCPKSFQNASNLNRHYEGIHKGDKKYQCDICEKRFQMPHILATHKRIHTGERPFGCEQCGKRFSDPSTLWRHRKNVCKE